MKYIKKILDNGMVIILVPMKNTPLISIGFFVEAGSRNETIENNGIAHFLEHMMFKGTTTRTPEKMFYELDVLGAIYNAVTTSQHTYYYVYGSADDTKKLLDIMIDIYVNPVFQTKEINKERKVIIEEMRMRSDTPYMKLYSAFHQKMFAGTSLEHDVIGTTETVMNFKRDDFIDFRTALYKPENTVFVMAGNFNPIPIYKIIERVLKQLDNPKIYAKTYFDEKSVIIKNMMDQDQPYVYIKKNLFMQQVYVLLAFPMYDLYGKNHREIDLLAQLLSAGFSSRLYKALREKKGITYKSDAYPIVYSDSGAFMIQMIINPTELVTGLKILMKELKRTKTELMHKNELIKIVNTSKNESMYSLTRPIDLLIYFGLNFLSNRKYKSDLKKEFTDLQKVTKADIRDIANEIFIRNRINLFMYGNIEQTDYDFLDL